METTTLEQTLEQGEARFPEITALYNWTLNYEAQEGPFTLFLDLIGYSRDEHGHALYNMESAHLGYLELDYLADALKEYARIGQDAHDYVLSILSAEVAE